MIEIVQRYIIPAAYTVLPPAMASPQASALLLAIGLQESKFVARHQLHGTARGFWQFEAETIHRVLVHPASAVPVRTALRRLCYPDTVTESTDIHRILEHHDMLAACLARCLLWTDRRRLPEPTERLAGWQIYLTVWKPGRPHHEYWDANYLASWDRVLTALKA